MRGQTSERPDSTDNRDAITVSLTAPMRRANVRQRLQALSDRYGLPLSFFAGRALTMGLDLGERDESRFFVAPAASASTSRATPIDDRQLSLVPPTVRPKSAPKSEPKPAAESAPGDEWLSSEKAADALGYKDPDSFKRTANRYLAKIPESQRPRIRRTCQRDSRAHEWNFPALRALLTREGWNPRR